MTDSKKRSFRRHLVNDAAFAGKAVVVTAASAIPVVGGPISSALSMWEGERVSRRIETFIDALRDDVTKLGEEKLDRSYIETEEFQDVVISGIQSAKRSSTDEKRRWISAVLVGAASVERPADLDAEALLDTLGSITVQELLILRWTLDAVRSDGTFHVAWLPIELQGPDLDFHLHRLQAAGMIDYVADRPTTGSYDWRIYRVTPTFQRMATLVRLTDSRSESDFG